MRCPDDLQWPVVSLPKLPQEAGRGLTVAVASSSIHSTSPVSRHTARVIARARILLKSNDGWAGWAAPKVAEALDVALGTVYRNKQRFAEEGLDGALWDRRQVNRHRKLDDRGEAHLIALACSEPPAGHDHWTLRLLAGKVVELGLASSMSHEGVRKWLKKTLSSRGRSRSGASPR